MTLNELIFDSLETFETIYIDYNSHTKQLTNELYDMLESKEIINWYLNIKNNKPVMIIKLDWEGI